MAVHHLLNAVVRGEKVFRIYGMSMVRVPCSVHEIGTKKGDVNSCLYRESKGGRIIVRASLRYLFYNFAMDSLQLPLIFTSCRLKQYLHLSLGALIREGFADYMNIIQINDVFHNSLPIMGKRSADTDVWNWPSIPRRRRYLENGPLAIRGVFFAPSPVPFWLPISLVEK